MAIEINGQQYQHSTTKILATLTGLVFPLKTIKSFEYKIAAPKKPTNDANGKVTGFTIDKEVHSGTMTLKLSELLALDDWCQGQNSLGLGQQQFDFVFQYGPRLGSLKQDSIYGLMFDESGRKSDDGQEVLMVDIPIFFLDATLNGRPFIVRQDD